MARKLIVEVVADPRQFTKGLATADRSAKQFGRSMETATRGIVSGSGALRGFTRSLAFASGGFLAFEGVTSFLEKSVDAAREAGQAQRSLAAQMRAAGESFSANREQIERVAVSYGKFGFQNDEVIQSLTVLERGTQNINQAIQLQGVTADIARAKNIDLAAAANVVAKVFGGQETALRRAVPGLDKNAHGWDLIREAQQRVAGQAAANTTASEKFAATLHDTEEIVGTQLLPILNQYLGSLGDWLQKMNESGKLQKDVNQAVKTATGLFRVAKTAVDDLDAVTGSFKTTLELLLGVFAAFKAARFISWFSEMAGSIGGVTTASEAAAAEAGTLSGALSGLTAAPWVITVIVAYKDVKDPGSILGRAKGLFDIIRKGGTPEKILENLPTIGPVIKALNQGTRAFGGGGGGTNPLTRGFGTNLFATPYGPARPAPPLNLPGTVTGATRFGPTIEQRNAAFDAAINRQLGRVQDITSVQGQIGRLQQIGTLIQRRIAVTKDITRRLNLEDRLLEVFRQIKADRQQLQQDAIDALSLNVDKAGLTATLNDDIAALETVNAGIAQQQQQYGYTIDRQRQIIANQQQIQGLRAQQAQQRQQAREQAQAARQQALETKRGWLDFAVERAEATKTLKDDVKAYRAVETFLKQRIKQEGRTLELVKDLWETRQKIRDLNKKNTDDVDPLAGLRQVSSKQLASMLALGTGLSLAGQRTLAFNIAGAEIQPVHVHVHMDGREVGSVVARQQARADHRTARQTSGFRG